MSDDFDFEDGEGLWAAHDGWGKPQPVAQRGRANRVHVTVGPAPVSDWAPPEYFPELSGLVGLDTETKDPKLDELGPGWAWEGGGNLIGVSVSWGQNERAYFPFAHESGGGQLPQEHVLNWLKDQLKKPEVEWVTHNGLYDFGWLKRHGLPTPKRYHDTMVLCSLLNEYRYEYNLDAMAREYNGSSKDEKLLRAAAEHYGVDPKNEMYRLPAKYVGPYAEGDAFETRRLFEAVYPMAMADGLAEVYALEMQLQEVLIAMRMRGVRVDLDGAERAREQLLSREREIQSWLKARSGTDVNPWMADSLAKVFDRVGVSYPLTPKTKKPSFTKDWLEEHPSPEAQAIFELRQINKARTTFIEGHILRHSHHGRVHPQFNQLRSDKGGTVSGRFSSSTPNFQQLPSKEKKSAKIIRGLCLPEEGQLWAALDYSQQEPRLTVHYAALMKCEGAAEMVKQYIKDPSTDFHAFVAQLTSLERTPAKTMNLALIYGRGEVSTCHALGLPTYWDGDRERAGPEGKALFKQYHDRVPFVRELSEAVKRQARRRGQLRTLGSRICHFPDGYSLHKALNRLIQSSAADMIKRAMIEQHREGLTLLVTVHDENGLSVASKEEARRAADIMESVYPLRLPHKVDVEIGPSWGAAA